MRPQARGTPGRRTPESKYSACRCNGIPVGTWVSWACDARKLSPHARSSIARSSCARFSPAAIRATFARRARLACTCPVATRSAYPRTARPSPPSAARPRSRGMHSSFCQPRRPARPQEACEMGVERFGTRARRRWERRTRPWACDAQTISTQAEKAKLSPCVRHARSRALCGQSACDARLRRTAWTCSDACVRHAPSRAESHAAVARFLHLPIHRTALGLRASVMRGRGQHSRVEACELLLPRKISKFEFQTENTRLVLKTSWYKMP